jgi:Skp family chaperone for outer membrane proteins
MTDAWKDRIRTVRPYAVAALIGAIALAGAVRAGTANPAPAAPAAAAAPGPRTPVVAVLDMSAVLNASDEWHDMGQSRNQLLQNAKEALNNLTQKAQVLRNEYDNLPPGTDQRTAKATELQNALQELQTSRQDYESQVSQSYTAATRTMFGKIDKIVAAYAREHGVDLVLKKQSMDLNGPDTLGSNIMLATTEVLYADSSLDISKAVIDRLNAEYKGPIEVK